MPSAHTLLRTARWLAVMSVAAAHEHHGEGIPEGSAISPEPLDGILWWHICFMVLAFGIMFPVGMVLGIVRSRWHVPLQTAATAVAIMAWFLGHAHRGRQFARNIHASFANSLMSMLALQVALGVYLKLHLEKGVQGRLRPYAVVLHGVVGKAMPVVAWVQMVFGGLTALGFCRGDHVGQCLAHFIMGSSFIAYGIIMTLMLLAGQGWLRRARKSQEFFDSLVITLWGIVNTFTEHRWGHAWAHNDVQHTSMGVVWWCAGLLGLWLSRARAGGAPRRNFVPGMVIVLTGYAMSGHPQHLPLSTMVHAVFGYTLMAAGAARIVEVCFVDSAPSRVGEPNNFQHLPPFLLFAGGFIFMAATEEQMALVNDIGIDHVSYLLILYSLAFLLYLFVQILLHIFLTAQPEPKPADPERRGNGIANTAADRAVADAEEFELEGLISDDEGSQHGKEARAE